MFGGVAPWLVRQLPGIVRPSQGQYLRDDCSWQPVPGQNLLANAGFNSIPRTGVVGSGTPAYGPTNWFINVDVTTNTFGSGLVSGSTLNTLPPPGASRYFSVTNPAATAAFTMCQAIENAGPYGLSSTALANQRVTFSITGQCSLQTGNPVLNAAIFYWSGTADASGSRNLIASYSLHKPNFNTTNLVQASANSVPLIAGNWTTLATSCVLPAATAFNNVAVIFWITPYTSTSTLFFTAPWFGLGDTAPPVWYPHPADALVSRRYCVPLVDPSASAWNGFLGNQSGTNIVRFPVQNPGMRVEPTLFGGATTTWSGSTPVNGDDKIAALDIGTGTPLTITGALTLSLASAGSELIFLATAGTAFAGSTQGSALSVRVGNGVHVGATAEI